ncbi:unnamed protein product, partial [marine sediment metagenome]
IKRKQSKVTSKNIVAIKVMAFLSWLIYIGIAFANDIMIEAFIFSVGLVIIGYIIFGCKSSPSQQELPRNNNVNTSDEKAPSHNYLAVFFHNSDQAIQLNSSNTMK